MWLKSIAFSWRRNGRSKCCTYFAVFEPLVQEYYDVQHLRCALKIRRFKVRHIVKRTKPIPDIVRPFAVKHHALAYHPTWILPSLLESEASLLDILRSRPTSPPGHSMQHRRKVGDKLSTFSLVKASSCFGLMGLEPPTSRRWNMLRLWAEQLEFLSRGWAEVLGLIIAQFQ